MDINFQLNPFNRHMFFVLANQVRELFATVTLIRSHPDLRILAVPGSELSDILDSMDTVARDVSNLRNTIDNMRANRVPQLEHQQLLSDIFGQCFSNAYSAEQSLETFLKNQNFIVRHGQLVEITSETTIESIDTEDNSTTPIESEASENISVESIEIQPDQVILKDNQAFELEPAISNFYKLVSVEISRPIKCNLIEKLSSKYHSVSASPVMVASLERDIDGINKFFFGVQLQANFAISNLKPTNLKPATRVSIEYKNSKVSLQKFTNNAENTYSASIEKKIQLKNQQTEISATLPFSNGKIKTENFHVSTKTSLPGGNLVKYSKNNQNYFLSVKPSIQIDLYPTLGSSTLGNQEKGETNLCRNENYCFGRSSSDCHEVDDWPDCTVNSRDSLHDYNSVYDNNANISGNKHQAPKKISTVCVDPYPNACNYQSKNTAISMGFFSLVGLVAVGLSYKIIKSLKTKFNK